MSFRSILSRQNALNRHMEQKKKIPANPVFSVFRPIGPRDPMGESPLRNPRIHRTRDLLGGPPGEPRDPQDSGSHGRGPHREPKGSKRFCVCLLGVRNIFLCFVILASLNYCISLFLLYLEFPRPSHGIPGPKDLWVPLAPNSAGSQVLWIPG